MYPSPPPTTTLHVGNKTQFAPQTTTPNHGQPPPATTATTAAPTNPANAPPNKAGAAPLGVLVPLAAAEAEPEAAAAEPEAEMSAALLEGRKGAVAVADPVGVRETAEKTKGEGGINDARAGKGVDAELGPGHEEAQREGGGKEGCEHRARNTNSVCELRQE
ncbi:hypothetical protein B0H16DRAFT_1833088 [Mycena metata]|uniref:Uncharacterized protein n=1 Tax=Mycena metata TaxID=1033252 RepID=A0AAD7IZR3_9AGAR|nr:hypothetical protein B0H16DRAFT_1833088 [Mycena metata]